MEKTKINFFCSQSLILVGSINLEFLKKSYGVSQQDFFVIDDDYTISHVKELLHFIYLKPFNSQKKLAVISNIENLNVQAANTLLKTLEEPPPYATLILTTLAVQKILPTILSRCTKIRLEFTADLSNPENYLSPLQLGKKTVAEKFKWAAQAAETENVEKIILLWLNFYREKLLAGENVLGVIKRLLLARDLLQTNISVKLLLENLLLDF